MDLQHGHVTIVPRGAVTIHMFTSPEEGEGVNSQIIETSGHLVVVDVPLLKPYALEFRAYIDSLGKPVDRLFLTHAHPDHWFSLFYFKDLPVRALAAAIEEMKVLRDVAVGYHTSIHPEMMPEQVILPEETVEPGPYQVDGVRFNILALHDVESTAQIVLDIPDERTLIAQDLVYNHTHMYLATQTADGQPTAGHWIETLEDFKERGYETIIPGHGVPAGPEVFEESLAYLRHAKEVLETAKTGEEFIDRIKTAFPDHQTELILNMSEFMIYQYGKS